MQYKKCFYIRCDRDCSVLKIPTENRINKKKKNRKTLLLAECDESNKSNQEFTRANIPWMLRWRRDLARFGKTEFSIHLWDVHHRKRFFRRIIVTVAVAVADTRTPVCVYTTPTRTRPRITYTYTYIHRILRNIHARTYARARAHATIHMHHSRSVATTRGSRECTRRSLSPISQEKSDERIRGRSPRRSRVTTTRTASVLLIADGRFSLPNRDGVITTKALSPIVELGDTPESRHC